MYNRAAKDSRRGDARLRLECLRQQNEEMLSSSTLPWSSREIAFRALVVLSSFTDSRLWIGVLVPYNSSYILNVFLKIYLYMYKQHTRALHACARAHHSKNRICTVVNPSAKYYRHVSPRRDASILQAGCEYATGKVENSVEDCSASE